jgi:hypothetical protein
MSASRWFYYKREIDPLPLISANVQNKLNSTFVYPICLNYFYRGTLESIRLNTGTLPHSLRGIFLPNICNDTLVDFFLCFLVRASSYILISRPTDATCDRFLFSIYMMYNSTCFERQALIIRSPSLYIQPPVSVFVSVSGTVL